MSNGDPTGQSWTDPAACSHAAQDVIKNNLAPGTGWCSGCGDPVIRKATRIVPGIGRAIEWVLANPPEGRTGTGEGPGTMLPPEPPPRAS